MGCDRRPGRGDRRRPDHPRRGGTTALTADGVGRADLDAETTVRANRSWWDGDADAYQSEHGTQLGLADFVWCPENLHEDDAQLLGPPQSWRGRRVLEVGAGAAACSRWLAARGARPVATDLSAGMLRHARAGNAATGLAVPLVQADAQHLPFADAAFDMAFTAFGAIPFVADSAALMREVARVLTPGGRWVFAVSHPIRWIFPDDPGPDGLTASIPYFDRSAYVEYDGDRAIYAEHHRTLGDRVRELVAAGFRLTAIVEPEWPDGFDGVWGQWSPLRGRILPGTAIFCTVRD